MWSGEWISGGPKKTWVYGALRVRDGKELTRCAASRTSTNYIALLQDIEADNATGNITSSSTTSPATTVPKPTLGWLSIPGFIRSSFPRDLLAQSARGLVAALPSRCPGRAEFRQPR